MTVPYHYEESDHHIGMTATMAAFVAVLIAVAGLTIWQAGFEGGGTTQSDRSIAETDSTVPSAALVAASRFPDPSLAGQSTQSAVSIPSNEWELPTAEEVRALTSGASPFPAANGGPGGTTLDLTAQRVETGPTPAQALADFPTPEAAGGLPDVLRLIEATPTEASPTEAGTDYPSGPVENPIVGSRVR